MFQVSVWCLRHPWSTIRDWRVGEKTLTLLPLWQVSVLGVGWYLGVWQVLLCGQQYVIVTHLDSDVQWVLGKLENYHPFRKTYRLLCTSNLAYTIQWLHTHKTTYNRAWDNSTLLNSSWRYIQAKPPLGAPGNLGANNFVWAACLRLRCSDGRSANMSPL